MNDAADKNWFNESVKKFYSENRSVPSQLYPSEKHFLDTLDLKGKSVLDIGCACGGFYNIFNVLYGGVNYTGVDISTELITEARRLYPSGDFRISSGAALEFGDSSFDMVFSSGVFHLIENGWRDLYRHAYRVSKDIILVDFRLTGAPQFSGRIRLDFYSAGGSNYAVYTVVNIFELFDFLNALRPKPVKISAYGYMHRPSAMSDIGPAEICMAFFLVEKGFENGRGIGGAAATQYRLELPFDNIENMIRERYS